MVSRSGTDSAVRQRATAMRGSSAVLAGGSALAAGFELCATLSTTAGFRAGIALAGAQGGEGGKAQKKSGVFHSEERKQAQAPRMRSTRVIAHERRTGKHKTLSSKPNFATLYFTSTTEPTSSLSKRMLQASTGTRTHPCEAPSRYTAPTCIPTAPLKRIQ